MKKSLNLFSTNFPFFSASPFSFPIPSLIFPLILLTPFLPFTPFFFSPICMNLLFFHPTPILALFQLLFLSLFLITTSIYFYPSLFSFYTYFRLKILRYFHPLPTEPSIHPDVIMDWIWLHFNPHKHS